MCRTGVPQLSQFHAGLALEPQQTADVKIAARPAVALWRPGTPNAAQTSTYESRLKYTEIVKNYDRKRHSL